ATCPISSTLRPCCASSFFFAEEIQDCGLAKNQVEPTMSAFNKLVMLDTYVTSDQIAQFAKRRVVESGNVMLANQCLLSAGSRPSLGSAALVETERFNREP